MNDTLRSELLRMQKEDLALRARLARDGTLFDGYAPEMAALHRTHNARLREILDECGCWPGRSVVGEDGAAAAWLLVQHAILDPELMRSALALLEAAVQSGDADPQQLAYLHDRVCTLEGRPQVFGTNYDWDEHGELSPLPIQEPAAVDARRRDVGLPPLAENTRRIREQAAAEGETAPADYARRQRDFLAWATAVGWRK